MIQDRKHKLFNRSWRISVIPKNKWSDDKYSEKDAIVISSSDYGDGALKCVFNVASSLAAYNYGDITVYNMNHKTIQMIASEGGRIAIEAGYKDDDPGLIWQGYVWHSYDYRENVVDRVFTMHCVDTIAAIQSSFVAATLSEPTLVKDKLEYVTKQMKVPWGTSDAMLKEKTKTVRGLTFFRDGKGVIKEEAQIRGVQVATDQNGKLTTTDLIKDVAPDEEIVISPSSGLIGTPTQIPKGISFQTLIDPRIRFKIPPIRVRIDYGEIRAMPLTYGEYMGLLEPHGTYKVIYVNHVGDTRGNDWYTNVQGVVNPEMLANMGPTGSSPTANIK